MKRKTRTSLLFNRRSPCVTKPCILGPLCTSPVFYIWTWKTWLLNLIRSCLPIFEPMTLQRRSKHFNTVLPRRLNSKVKRCAKFLKLVAAFTYSKFLVDIRFGNSIYFSYNKRNIWSSQQFCSFNIIENSQFTRSIFWNKIPLKILKQFIELVIF